MHARPKRPILRWLVAGATLLALVGGAVAVADPDESGPTAGGSGRSANTAGARSGTAASSQGVCGAASVQTVASVDERVARRIYEGELHGAEVRADVAHVAGSPELLNALASSNAQAVHSVVYGIVYTPHWHIVRLRVTQNSRVLADVGGPDIIAPISGPLVVGAKKVGTYTMSVQDDAGYVKLVSRFIGVPIDLYGTPRAAGSFLMGTLKPAPPPVRSGTSVKVAGATYLTEVLQTSAFPAGKLQAALFVPTPSTALATQSCQAVRLAAWGNIVKHVAARFSPLATNYQAFVGTLQGATASPTYVRVGSHQIAGLNAGPSHIPPRGTVKYRGLTWHVFSWAPHPPARIYFLAPGA